MIQDHIDVICDDREVEIGDDTLRMILQQEYSTIKEVCHKIKWPERGIK